ncbi:specificity determinant HsdS [Lacticaseibacillus zeae DSM 20178 = KCTC 3804]|uniref:Specificity determinant HsdS n=1 Tax=Lacticaseibacillus zeae DSM 20178 = KCTC 3804 TaxID=1423816 RepID=A0A0R1EJ95_LACZE|nr:restriction endonuclease subunit S [Lacticaseibacillus zeae]KRK09513.1 specificity determinant HsdS [Lacticaseibacillus zeae DSM 20178 = KCTC 3804]OLS06479.1 restriction endonuclease subunit S [Lacticaseibacillus casei]QVI31721.1 restriction endonuclease subunit S [Lacticaseibacillus zeae]
MNAKQAKYPQLRFKGFTDPWVQRNLGDLAEIVRGASPRPIQDPKWFDDSSEIGWLRISDVTEQNGRIHHLDQHISEAGQAKTRVLTEPHLLLSIAATVGKPLVNYVKTGVHDGFLIFMNPKFDLEFMFQWLESYRDKWSRYGQPGSQVNLNSDLVKNQSISIPSMDEQQKLGEFFTSIDNLITANQRKLDLLKEQKKGYLQKMFPKNGSKFPQLRFADFADAWEQRKVSELADRYDNLRVPITASERVAGETPYYGANGIQDYVEGFTHNGEFVLVAEDGANDLQNYPVQYVDGKVWVNNHAHVLQAKEERVDNKFLKNALKHTNIEPYLVGGGRAKLNADVMMKINFKVPTLPEQVQIGKFFDNLDHLITLHQRKLEKLQELKKGYLQKMFC